MSTGICTNGSSNRFLNEGTPMQRARCHLQNPNPVAMTSATMKFIPGSKQELRR